MPGANPPADSAGAAAKDAGAANLTDLADRHGSDKGSAKHRYTELYHMLFQPLRKRAVTLLEMGLQIGGPEHGAKADRQTTDLPSIRMWLDYFPKARIHGLDVSDFSWFAHDRFTFHRCDMDDRAALAATARALPPLDIVLDDASHASHHQQNAFLEIFPRLRPGGLYIIEDLRWQPPAYERPGITRTADLLRAFSETRHFSHDDPAVLAEFTALAPQISGCFLHQVQYARRRRDQVAVIHKR
jgi:SAM-dependent methyltransferase